jgi:hypothetical protein
VPLAYSGQRPLDSCAVIESTAAGNRAVTPAWHGQVMRRRLLSASLLSAILCAAGSWASGAAVAAVPGAPSCPMFPADNVLNTDISTLPVNAHSAQWLAGMGGGTRMLHPDFGPTYDPGIPPYGIPFTVVDGSHVKVPVHFQYGSESDPGPYPFGPDTPIEGGASSTGDRHALMLESDTCTLYELYDARYAPGAATAGSGAVYNLRSDALRPAGWTSADAAGLPVMPLLLRPDEVRAGSIRHAIRVTAASTDRSFLWPARHQAGSAANPALPPMGARLRLRAGVDISHYSAAARVVLTAFRHYGLIVADNGSNWYFQGSADPSWDPALIGELKTIPAADFEAVDESALMADPNSGRVRGVPAAGPPPPPPAPRPGATSPTPPPAPPASPPPPAATPVAVAVPVEPATPSPAAVPSPPAAADLRPMVSGASRRPPSAATLVVAGVVVLAAIGGVAALGRRRRA